METSSDKIILFPKWKEKLEKDSLEALKNNEFEIALGKLNKLLRYQVNDYEVITGKLICLMELNRYNEAQELCEQLLNEETEHYFQFVHIYLTILFQTNQYGLLIEKAAEELEKKHLPETYRSQFKQLYEMSEKMKVDIDTTEHQKNRQELFEFVKEEDYTNQWRTVNRLRKKKAMPDDQVTELLIREDVHPVIKTELCLWLREARIKEKVNVHKFNKKISFTPADIEDIMELGAFEEIANIIEAIEHQNPTMHEMLHQILYHYAYVLYPLTPPLEDVDDVGQALVKIGEKYLNIHKPAPHHGNQPGEKIKHYIENVTMCETLYMSVIFE